MKIVLFAVTFIFLLCLIEAGKKLTTAKYVIDSEIRPAGVNRTHIVNRAHDNGRAHGVSKTKIHGLLDVIDTLFRRKMDSVDSNSIERRKGTENIWEWDSWCHLQPAKGQCKKKITRYYYDIQAFGCKKFTYTGCDSNHNSFDSLEKCQKVCKGANDKISPPTDDLVCSYQPDPGMCLALMEKYYYDVNLRRCNRFNYGGCGGNPNRFHSLENCEQVCG